MGGGEDPVPAGRGGVGLPRRVDPQLHRRHRGYYIGGAGRDDGGYFALLPEQEYGGAGADDRGYFAPAPEQVHGGAGHFVGQDLVQLAEGIPFRVPRPGGSPGRDAHLPFARGHAGNLPFARGRAPPLLLEDALRRGPDHGDDKTRAGGGQVDAVGAADGTEGAAPGRDGHLPLAQGRAPPPLLDDAPGARDGNQHGEAGALGAAGHGGRQIGALGLGGQAIHRSTVEAETDLDLRSNRNHPDRKGNQLLKLEKKHRSRNESVNNRNEDLLDLISSMENLRNDIDVAKKDEDKCAVRKISKAYKGALAKAMRYCREITRAGGVPRPIPPKLLLLPSP